jgi:hypothetical protein
VSGAIAPPVTRKASLIPASANSKANDSEKVINASFSIISKVYFKASQKIDLPAIITHTYLPTSDCELN